MNTMAIIGSIALALAGVPAAGQAFGQTAQEKLERREAQRRVALAQHQKIKEFLARNCVKRDLTRAQLEACRAAYRQL
jgi:hypothetical protein